MESGFLFTGGVEVGELVLNAALFITVGLEDSLALFLGGLTGVTLVCGTVGGELCVSDFSFTEFLLFSTISGLLFGEVVMFLLFSGDFVGESIKHVIDIFNWASGLHHVLNLS